MGEAKQKRKNPYDSWDPLTQAKYIYDLKVQLGKPAKLSEAYKMALQIIKDSEAEKQQHNL